MGSSQRLAAVAAVAHAKHYYNHTQPNVVQTESTHFNINIFFVRAENWMGSNHQRPRTFVTQESRMRCRPLSATLCGVLVAVCAACCRRPSSSDKPEDVTECRGVYTVSGDARLNQVQQEEVAGPPPAYDIVVANSSPKDYIILQDVVSDGCPRCLKVKADSDPPSYEAAVLLKDTRL